MVLLSILGLIFLAAVAYGALQLAIAHNGPAVLSAVDRLTGGSVGTERSAPISFGDHSQQRLFVQRVPEFETDETRPVLLFIHGGSWASGDPEDYAFVGRAFAPRGYIVVEAGYRLGEAGRYPAMLEDGASALAWIAEHITEYGGDPSRIYVMGHSAGAYNATMLALDPRWTAGRGLPADTIKGVIALAGPNDFHPFDTEASRAAFGHAQHPEDTQPINHVRPDSPPMLLIHGEEDTTVKPRNSRVLAKALEQVGAVVETRFYPGWDHSDPLLALGSPWRKRRDVVKLSLDFMERQSDASLAVQAQSR